MPRLPHLVCGKNLSFLGSDAEGRKHVLGLREGTTENATVVRALLADLVDRGLSSERAPTPRAST